MLTLNLSADHNIRVLGRTVTEEKGLVLSWSNAGFRFRFRGQSLYIHFSQALGDAYVRLTIDKAVDARYAVPTAGTVIAVDDLPDKVHTVTLRLITESFLIVNRVDLPGDKTELLPPPEEKTRKLEFLGDSITCGFGNMSDTNTDGFYTYQEDSTRAYAFLTAAALDADIRTECSSGQGVVLANSGEPGYRIPEFFHHQIKYRDLSGDMREKYSAIPYEKGSYAPDAVIVNAGTNDWCGKVTKEDFYKGARDLIFDIRHTYPDTHIVWLYGCMLEEYNPTLKQLVSDLSMADDKIHFLAVKSIYRTNGECGVCGHPNRKGHRRIAKALTAYLKKILRP